MIIYEAEGVKFPNIKKRETTSWIRQVAASYGKKVGEIGYLFVNDEKILEVNIEFLQHNYYTDIITFDYSTKRRISGDMFISLDTVASNAELFGREYDEEFMRVVIHGVLHLCGINDKGEGEREIMEQHENDALALWKNDISKL
jgi:rRNA maturation RNase YbeY